MTVDAQLASVHAPVLHLVELNFAGGTARLTTWSHNLTWAGHTWAGINCVSSVSAVKVTDRPQYRAMDLGLYPSNDALLATALGDPAEYRGRALSVYQAVMDDNLVPLGDPELVWYGQMSQVRINTGDGETQRGSVVMRGEQQGRDSRAARSLRLNHAQHVARHPGDTFLSRIETLAGKPVPWLSKRFQQI